MIPKNDSNTMKRRAIRVGKQRGEKHLRAVVKEAIRLRRVQYDAPLVELEKPYQQGWMRYLRLTERAKRRPDVEKLERVLKLVNKIQFCRRNKFVRHDPKRGPWRHRPRKIGVGEVLRGKVPQDLFRYFWLNSSAGAVTVEKLEELRKQRRWGWLEVNCEQVFESHTVPYYVTHQKVDLPEVKSREDELQAWLESCHGWQKFDRLIGRSSSWWRCHGFIERQWQLKLLEEAEMKVEKLEFNQRRRSGSLSTVLETIKGTTNVVPFDFLGVASRLTLHRFPDLELAV